MRQHGFSCITCHASTRLAVQRCPLCACVPSPLNPGLAAQSAAGPEGEASAHRMLCKALALLREASVLYRPLFSLM